MLINGQTIQLLTTTQSGTDEFRRPTYTESWVSVSNVLIQPVGEQEALDTLNLTGKKAVYQLAIPKGDTHVWQDKKVQFFGKTFRVISAEIQGMDDLIPLDWNKKIKVEIVNE